MINAASPGVNSREIDLSYQVRAEGGVSGAFVGAFQWGPVEEITPVTGGAEGLLSKFFKPSSTASVARYWHSVRDYLIYNDSAQVVRLVGDTAVNAVAAGQAPVLVMNNEHFDSLSTTGINFYGRYPGALGNSIAVYAADDTGYTGWVYEDEFDYAPSAGEFNMVIVDTTGAWTGTAGTVLERYELMTTTVGDKKPDGTSAYIKEVINRSSKYVRMGDLDEFYFSQEVSAAAVNAAGTGYTAGDVVTVSGGTFETAATLTIDTVGASGEITGVTVTEPGVYSAIPSNPVSVTGGTGTDATFDLTFSVIDGLFSESLEGGVDDNILTSHVTGWNLFDNPATSDIWEMVAVNPDSADIDSLTTIAETRGDCVGFFSPLLADVVNNAGNEVTSISTYRDTTTNKNSSYLFMDDNWKMVYDEYNDNYLWIPLASTSAGLHAQVVGSPQPWQSPMGYTRGKVKNIVKLAWNSKKAHRDTLYKKNVNSYISEPGEGVVLMGDKTQLTRPSAFDRINVRDLFIVMRKAIAKAAKYQLGELNDAITRSLFTNRTLAFLETVQSGRGIKDKRVKCDEENNNGEIVDANGFVASIFVKPARSINFIQLNFVAVGTDVNFEEIENAV